MKLVLSIMLRGILMSTALRCYVEVMNWMAWY